MSTNPILLASTASTSLALKISSLALAGPTSLVILLVPPAPGMMPNLVSVRPSFVAAGPAMRRSHVSASSSPPPMAKPSRHAIVGIGSRETFVNTFRRPSRNASTSGFDMPLRSLRSAPAQKAPGTEERISSVRTVREVKSDEMCSSI